MSMGAEAERQGMGKTWPVLPVVKQGRRGRLIIESLLSQAERWGQGSPECLTPAQSSPFLGVRWCPGLGCFLQVVCMQVTSAWPHGARPCPAPSLAPLTCSESWMRQPLKIRDRGQGWVYVPPPHLNP